MSNARFKARDAANASNLANRRAKSSFYNSVNATMNNCSISAKHKFNILKKLMKNNKYSGSAPLKENDDIIHEPKSKSEIFNNHFASKSRVDGFDDVPPHLERIQGMPNLPLINTSPIEKKRLPFPLQNARKSLHSASPYWPRPKSP